MSDGGVHSHINHLFSMIEAAKQLAVPNCYIQFFSDGRDTRPNSGGKWQIGVMCLGLKSGGFFVLDESMNQ